MNHEVDAGQERQMPEIKCKILHLSDLHYTEMSDDAFSQFLDETKEKVPIGYRVRVTDIAHHLMEELEKQEECYDGICVTGDFTDRGDEAGFAKVERELIDRLRKLCREPRAICCVPGNHDVKWFLSATDANFLSKKFLRYKQFVEQNNLTSSLIPKGDVSHHRVTFEEDFHPVYLNAEKKLAILCINSAMRCGELNEARRQAILKPARDAVEALKALEHCFVGAPSNDKDHVNIIQERLEKIVDAVSPLSIFDIAQVTHDQIIALKRELDDARDQVGSEVWDQYLKIAILHHHLSTFDSQQTEHKAFEMCNDSSEVLGFLCDHQFDAVLTGHKHQPYVTTRTFNNRKIVVIGCSTIAGHPTRGVLQGLQALEISKRDDHLHVTVTKMPIDQQSAFGRSYFGNIRSQAEHHDYHMTNLDPNDIPTFQLRGTKRPYEQLIDAHAAQIYALTFRTLGESFKQFGETATFEKLEKVELYVPSLRTLYDNHPTLKLDSKIKREWKDGLEATLNGFLDNTYFPRLDHIEVIIISSIPTLTGAIITSDGIDAETEKTIIYTPVVQGIYPADIPTLIHKKSNDTDTPLFDAYCRLIENADGPYHPLRFTVQKGEQRRPCIKDFIERLALVCNNPMYEMRDCKFKVEANHEAYDQTNPDPILPVKFAGDIDTQFKDGGLEIINHEVKPITFSFNGYRNKYDTVKIKAEHFVAYFACLIWEKKLLLVEHENKEWPYDLPGGKRKETDLTWQDTIVREVFEEIGIILEPERLADNFLGTIYDHKSSKQGGQPVIASYCYYPLNEDEYAIVQMQDAATKDYSIEFEELREILEIKEKNNKVGNLEAHCHAPEFSIRRLCQICGC